MTTRVDQPWGRDATSCVQREAGIPYLVTVRLGARNVNCTRIAGDLLFLRRNACRGRRPVLSYLFALSVSGGTLATLLWVIRPNASLPYLGHESLLVHMVITTYWYPGKGSRRP